MTKYTLQLDQSEVEALINWNQEKQWEAARKESYLDADDYKKRVLELLRLVPRSPALTVSGV